MKPPYRSPDEEKLFCCYCKRWIVYPLRYTVEHLVPVSKGGSNHYRNKRPCCHTCNNERSNKDLTDWLLETVERIKTATDKELLLKRAERIRHYIHYIETAGQKLYRTTPDTYTKKKLVVNGRWPE